MNRIPLGCKAFDELLRGGVEKGSVTLLYGEAGAGKSNICLQLARNVIKEGKKVAYIDTEGLSYDRVFQVFENEDYVKDLLVFQVHSFEEQSDRVDKIVRMAEGSDILGLVIIDSITMFYRLNSGDTVVRNDFIRQTEALLNIAREYDVPVLVTSQVYTNMTTGGVEFLGGHAMHHNAKTIIRLEKKGPSVRTAFIVKHRSLPEGEHANYRIVANGLDDV